MRFFNILLLFFIYCSLTANAQTLFENQDLTNSPTINLNKPSKKLEQVASSIPSSSKPFISTNLESVIARGDLQLAYESPKPGGWATIVHLHINPQDTFTRYTGDYGLMGVDDFMLIKDSLIQIFICRDWLD